MNPNAVIDGPAESEAHLFMCNIRGEHRDGGVEMDIGVCSVFFCHILHH